MNPHHERDAGSSSAEDARATSRRRKLMSEAGIPILFQWDGEAMVPASVHWSRRADAQFVVGERYRLVEESDRSTASHRHEFAFIREAWNSFPDHLYDQFPSPEHLRKYGLIAKGHCTMTQHPCVSVAEAERLEAVLRNHVNTYAIMRRRGSVVTVYEAVSQSYRAMGKAMFQQSKSDLLEFVGDLIGVAPETLATVGRAA